MPHPIYARFACLCAALATLIAATPSRALDPNLPPSGNFNLTAWKVTLPDQTEILEQQLSSGFQSPDEFYTDPVTGGMVFKCPNDGETGGSTYPRSELREMLRAGNTSISTTGIGLNNWVFSTSSQANQEASGGVDGTLTATLTVDHVSTAGDSSMIGRVIVGQIHASNDEPCRLYYRKLPGNSKGSIYIAHEPTDATGLAEQWYDMIGSRSSSAPDPADGIALGEEWSYEIDAVGDNLTVTIMRAGKPDVVTNVNMSASGFADDWMYFKAGCYNQNNSGDAGQYAQVTFYALTHTHNAFGNNQPPAFTTDPINEINATNGAAYSSTIADNASDPESDPMTFSKVSGPAWLSVAANGALSGTPGAGDVGANVFTVQVAAAGGSDTATLNITVNPAGVNQPPTCSITSPTNGATFSASNNVTIVANAADVDGTVTKVEFYQGATLLGQDTSAPYSYSWNNVPEGNYSLTAKATDNNSAETTSTAVGITVDPSTVLSAADFESGFGEWVNVGGDSHDWTRDSGGTPTSNTGPSTGANGSTWYVYLETSSGGANDSGNTAILEGPDLTGSNRSLTFSYHMYGSQMGTLNVDVYSGGNWTNGVWSLGGQQHTSNGEAYTQQTVDLSAYSGTIRLRFRAVAAGGVRGDMAIDDIKVTASTETNQPPAFTADPINEINADEGVAYSSSIADNASDPESDPMTFSKVSGPDWLSVAGNGALSGTPGAGDVGANVFTVQVAATGGTNTAALNITVNAVVSPPTLDITLSGGNVVLSWPTNGTAGFNLESTPSMSAPSWSPAGSPTVVGDQNQVTTPATGDTSYYRLKKP